MTVSEPPRRTIADKFQVRERIGSGGFSTVWRATDLQGGPDVAVKFPRTDVDGANDAEQVTLRFRNEIDLLSDFKGGVLPTSMVRFVDGQQTDPMYLVLEYIQGTELPNRISESGISPGIETARRFGFPVIRTLEFLHRNGICYLDCKPENVIVRDRDDTPVLIDFNTAEPTGNAATLFYEDEYKAPEQTPTDWRGEEAGPWSDVYAAGKLLCYLLTGTTMTMSETPPDGIDVTNYGVDAPCLVRRIVQRATRADPAQRPRDAGSLLAGLYDACGYETAVAELTDRRTNVVCPIHSGETIGRVCDDGELPDVGVADSEQYVSPIHFETEFDGESWLIHDRSLNGTYIRTGDGWQHLLSSEGYRQLETANPKRVSDEKPYTTSRLCDQTEISLVDPSYVVDLEFHPEPQ